MKMKFHQGAAPRTMHAVVYSPPNRNTITSAMWTIATWPKVELDVPDDGREYALCAENLWDIATERLKYAAGQPFPLDERPDLITASALHELHAAGLNAKGDPA